MNKRINEIYELRVVNYPVFDAKILLEGVGVLIGEIVKYASTHPEDLKEKVWDISREDTIKLLHEYLDSVGKDYRETGQVLKI